METNNLFSNLFMPKRIAFFGISNMPVKWGFNIFHHILLYGYKGEILPINPNGGQWFGHKIYKSLDEVNGEIDLALIVVKSSIVKKVVEECGKRKIPAAIIITAGFSETGKEGKILEDEVIDLARKYNIRLVGPNTMGLHSSFPDNLTAMMSGQEVIKGNVAILSQSGNLGTSLTFRICQKGFGVSRLVSTGNEADLTMEDYLELVAQDDMTKVICIYLEGARDGKRFFTLAKEITKTKPIILLKGGQTAEGAKAAQSHTGALAGSIEIFKGMCRQSGIILVSSMDELVDVAGFLLSFPMPKGNKTGIITLGGGWGVLATDACAKAGLNLVSLTDTTINEINKILPPYWSHGNPVDLVAPSKVEDITDCIKILFEQGDMDIVFMLGLGYISARAFRWQTSDILDQNMIEPYARALIKSEQHLFSLIISLIEQFEKPIVPVVDTMPKIETTVKTGREYFMDKGIMVYSSPGDAIRSVAKIVHAYNKPSVEEIELLLNNGKS